MSVSMVDEVARTRLDNMEDEHSDLWKKLSKVDEALSDGKAFMASIRTELAIIKWIGALTATTIVAIFVKLLMEHK